MDQLMIDVTEISEVQVGDIATLIGQDGGATILAEEWSDLLGTIPYEIVCGFRQRLPRTLLSNPSPNSSLNPSSILLTHSN
jgi:alanine racemase